MKKEKPETKLCKYCKTEIPYEAKVCPNCRKKQGGKGCLIAIAVFVVIIIIAIATGSGGSSSSSNKAPKSSGATSQSESASKETEKPAEPEITKYPSSTYKVGTDIPAGEYVVFCDSLSGYFQVSSDSSGSLTSIIANENFFYNSIVSVSDGQYFQISGSYAVPINEVSSLDTSKAEMYKVGTYLPAGEYKLSAGNSMAYFEVAKDSSHNLMSIVSNGNFEGDTYVTVSDGQYLKISGCTINS